jgi:hypothetical protein
LKLRIEKIAQRMGWQMTLEARAKLNVFKLALQGGISRIQKTS